MPEHSEGRSSVRGELVPVWPDAWVEIWHPLVEEGAPDDLFCELSRELVVAIRNPPTVEELADVVDNSDQSRLAFQAVASTDFLGEDALASFFDTHSTCVKISALISYPTHILVC